MSKSKAHVYHFNNLGEFIGESEYEGIRMPMNSTRDVPPQVDPEKQKAVFDFEKRSWQAVDLLSVEINPEPTVTQLTPSLYIIDDFYTDPDAVRQFALKQRYVRYAPTFPGRRSANLASIKTRAYFEKILGIPIKWGMQSFDDQLGVMNECNGVFQLMCENDFKNTYIHADDQMDFAAICYLNPDHQDDPGTGFYKHSLTGFDRMPGLNECLPVAAKLGVLPLSVRTMLSGDGSDESQWQLTHFIPMRFNRLVFYDAQLFHRNLTTFGNDADTGRLTQVFFLSKA